MFKEVRKNFGFGCMRLPMKGEEIDYADYYYGEVHTKNGGKASECIKCGKCEKVCPQHLPIRDLLVSVAKEFEK